MFKNTASQKAIFFAFDSTTNLPKVSDTANLTAYVSKDYGSVTVLGDTIATEMDATNAKGYYLFDLTQAETNADTLLFSAKSSTANIVVVGVPATVFTLPTSFATLLAHLDADISSRMATYTQPTGFLAATFPSDPAGLAGLASAHGAGSWATATGFSTLDAAGVRSAVGLAAANLDGQLSGIAVSVASVASSFSFLVQTNGTAASATPTTLTTGTVFGDVTNNVVGNLLALTGGTGSGQCRVITAYNATTDTYTVDRAWTTTPDNTTTFAVLYDSVPALNASLQPTVAALATQAQTDVRSAVGLATANLDTQLTTIDDFLDTEIAAIKAKTDQLTFTVANHVDATASGSDPTAIAAAVLDLPYSGHTASGTLGGSASRLGSGQIVTVGNVAYDGSLSLTKGASYQASRGLALDWTDTLNRWPDPLTGAVITLEIGDGALTVTGSIVTATGSNKKVRAEPTTAQTNQLVEGVYAFSVVATFGSERVPLVEGKPCTVGDREDT